MASEHRPGQRRGKTRFLCLGTSSFRLPGRLLRPCEICFSEPGNATLAYSRRGRDHAHSAPFRGNVAAGLAMEYFLQQLINGLTLGSIYGLIAIGYTMVYGIIGMINFAHGDIFMVGAFLALI